MVEVKFYDNVADEFLKFAVIISKTDNKWVFCKHKERETYEIPGGHREPGESILETAKRELQDGYQALRKVMPSNRERSLKRKKKFTGLYFTKKPQL